MLWTILVAVGAGVIWVIAYNYGRGKEASIEMDRKRDAEGRVAAVAVLASPLFRGKDEPEYPSVSWWRKNEGEASIWMAGIEYEEGAQEIEMLTIVGNTILNSVRMPRKDAYAAIMSLKDKGWKYATNEAVAEGKSLEQLKHAPEQ
jgi:hypothetical protein